MWKINLVEEGPQFRSRRASSQFLLLPTLDKVPEGRACKFKGFLLHDTEHPENAVSHVSIQDNKSVSARTRLFSRSCVSQSYTDNRSFDSGFLRRIIFSDEYVFYVSGFANVQNTRIWGTENLRKIQPHELRS